MKYFLSCDWGTTSFRLKLVEIDTLATLAEVQHEQGIKNTFSSWQQHVNTNRFDFFLSVIKDAIDTIETRSQLSLNDVPVIVSGMASSSLGMIDLPYKKLPFKTDGSDLHLHRINASRAFHHDLIIISGACSHDDVMRGEETQLVGAADVASNNKVYIFPGTHSKHISVKGGEAFAFKTFMTGELFALLSKNSTLTQAVEGVADFSDSLVMQSFEAGVQDSIKSNILHKLFTIRAKHLLHGASTEWNQAYLSGLLIGCEVSDLVKRNDEKIILVTSHFNTQYKKAMEQLGLQVPFKVVSDKDVTVKGQLQVLHNMS